MKPHKPPINGPSIELRLRVMLGREIVFGPGKAELLERIRDTGSITAAGKAIGMSYKRAWQLVETMNVLFAEPLVERSRGGAERGGAALTPAGERALALYRSIQKQAESGASGELDELQSMVRLDSGHGKPVISDRK